MRKSISSMYFSTTAILLIVSTAVMGLIQMYLVMGYFQEDKRSTLNDVVQVTAMQVQEGSPLRRLLEDENARSSVQDQMRLIGRTSSTNLLLTDASGQVMLYTQNEAEQLIGSQVDADILRQAQEEDGFFETGNLGGLYGGKYYTVGRVMRDESGAAAGYVFASASAASLLAIFVTNRLTTPLRRISEAARKFGSGDFSVRVPVDGNDEVAQLAVTFNNMARNLETIDSSRASFMGNIAHELRTPMTSIKGFIDGMLDGTIPDELRQHYLGLVSQEVGRLTRLIQNMLDISKLEAGEYRVNAQSYDIWESITGVVFSAEQRIQNQHVEIQGLAPTRTMVYADQDLVYQVVYNILDNAIKFTPEGGYIRFSVKKSGGMVTVSIRNSGQGIGADALPFVFERFYKEDKSRGLNARGSGLGLHICKILVGLSGGKIWAESEEGQWCQFNFTLPCEAPPEQRRKQTGKK